MPTPPTRLLPTDKISPGSRLDERGIVLVEPMEELSSRGPEPLIKSLEPRALGSLIEVDFGRAKSLVAGS